MEDAVGASRRMSGRTMGIVVGILVGAVSIAGGAAEAGERGKADVCHRTGDGEWRRISVSVNAVDAHRRQGGGLVHEAVPGVPGAVFDDSCAPVPSETILAVAYTDVIEDGQPYDPEVDVLIAKLVDSVDGDGTLGKGDKVVANRYPTTLTGPFEADAFEQSAFTEHTVQYIYGRSMSNCSVGFEVGGETATMRWFSDKWQEGYNDGRGSGGAASWAVDRLDWPGRPDLIDLDPGPSARSGGRLFSELVRADDQPFVDVDGACASSN